MIIEQYSIYEIEVKDISLNNSTISSLIYAVVISPDEMNDMLKTVIVAPLCNTCSLTPTTFLVDKISRIRLDQIFTVDKININKYIEKINISKVPKIKDVLNEMFVR